MVPLDVNPPAMRNDRSHTKVVATVGPATSQREVLEQMIREGVDVFRINFSHGTHEAHLKIIKLLWPTCRVPNCGWVK
jgi:pyruvate kinase